MIKNLFYFILFFFFSFSSFASPLKINSVLDKKGFQHLQINWNMTPDLKMAFFKHNQYVYLIFNQKFDVKQTRLEEFNYTVLEHPSALILRGVLDNRFADLSVSLKGDVFSVKIAEQTEQKKSLFSAKPADEGMLLEIKDSQIIDFQDPNTLEKIVVFLVPYSPIFTAKQFNNPEFLFLKTVLGLVVLPKTDKLNIQKNENGYLILPQNQSALKNDLPEHGYDILNLGVYENLSQEEFEKQLQELSSFVPVASQTVKDTLHLEMAKLYFIRGFSEKAFEVLSLLPESTEKHSLLFLIYIKQNMLDKALQKWHKIQNPDENLHLWNNAINNQPLFSKKRLEQQKNIPNLSFLYWYHIAQKALNQNNAEILSLAIQKIKELNLNVYQNQAYLYFKARLEQMNGQLQNASQIYKQISFNPVSALNDEILISQILVDLTLETMSPKEAILKLEKNLSLNAFTDTHVLSLQLLSLLYYQQKNLLEALRTDRKLLFITKDTSILKRMKKVFADFFTSHQCDTPFLHLTIYQEFQELMPLGVKAVKIKQHLLNDYLSLDLLENAYDVAVKIIQMKRSKASEEAIIQAYLIAQLLDDNKKISEIKKFLPFDWKEKTEAKKLHPILKKAFQIYD
ncbi:MAG: hypothetical protein E7013_05050 [Alphaproteobacteria bacterium]|nr:hypothetical protein [Alphaproteobacteria bacterium]